MNPSTSCDAQVFNLIWCACVCMCVLCTLKNVIHLNNDNIDDSNCNTSTAPCVVFQWKKAFTFVQSGCVLTYFFHIALTLFLSLVPFFRKKIENYVAVILYIVFFYSEYIMKRVSSGKQKDDEWARQVLTHGTSTLMLCKYNLIHVFFFIR